MTYISLQLSFKYSLSVFIILSSFMPVCAKELRHIFIGPSSLVASLLAVSDGLRHSFGGTKVHRVLFLIETGTKAEICIISEKVFFFQISHHDRPTR